VATTCYSVLKARSAQYAKGQAPDWCTSSGGQASAPASGQTYAGLGMTDDAIRTPWRICMDALWFDNADAKAFGSNSRNTLTQWAAVTPTNQTLLTQYMGQYTNTQSVISATAGSFHFIAMWLCSAIGSKDAAYAKQCINGTLLQRIAGQTDCFGDKAMSDQYYYYNQSIAMLGFAAITGMFPNVLSDTIKAYVKNGTLTNTIRQSGVFGAKALQGGIGFSLPESGAPGRGIFAALYDVRGKKSLSYATKTGVSDGKSGFFIPIGKGRLSAGMYILKVTVPEALSRTTEYSEKINWK
jgi:hypothetical protein